MRTLKEFVGRDRMKLECCSRYSSVECKTEPERRDMHLDSGNISLLVRLVGLLAVQGTEGIHEALEEGPLFTQAVMDGLRGLLFAERGQFPLLVRR